MLQLIVTLIFMVSLGAILYIVVRALPRIDDAPVAYVKKSIFERWVVSEIPERVDALLNSFFGKLLRKLKVFLLKIDNRLTERLKKMKAENGNGKKLDWSEITKEKNLANKEETHNN